MAFVFYETNPPDSSDHYITLKSLGGLMWNPNTDAEEPVGAADQDDFDIQGTEDGSGSPGSGQFRFQIPNDLPIKTWRIRFWKQAGGTPDATTDECVETRELFWNGLAMVDPPDFYAEVSFSGSQIQFNIGTAPKVDGSLVGYTVRVSHPTAGEEGALAWSTHQVIDHTYDADVHVITLDSACLFTLEGGETAEFTKPSGFTGTGDMDDEEGGGSGGGVLSARIGYSSLVPEDYLEIIQGEEKTITFVVEADGRFAQAVADEIRVGFRDPDGNTVIIVDSDVERVCEELDIQVIRVTLSPEDTYTFIEGLMRIEIAFDDQKAGLQQAVKIVEGLIGTGT